MADLPSLHADAASGIDTFLGNGGRLLKAGNSKLGTRGRHGIMLVASGLAIHDCPGKTVACEKICYAAGFNYLMFLSQRKGSNHIYSYLAHKDLDRLREILTSELTDQSNRATMLRTPLVVRIHEAGDFVSVAHVAMWKSVAASFPTVTFYGYSHSFNNLVLAVALNDLNTLSNVVIRRSYDEGSADVAMADTIPVAFVAGNVKGHKGADGRADMIKQSAYHKGAMRCPEQVTHHAINCTDCGICWNKPKVPVQFFKH